MAETLGFPESFRIADQASLNGQRRFISSTRVQLLLLVLASGAGALSWTVNGSWDAAALLAGAAFLAAAALRLALLRRRPHRVWYDGRAAAESIKTLAWKYAVRGDPFVAADGSDDERFGALSRDVLDSFEHFGTTLSAELLRPTENMDVLRSRPLEARRHAYARGRIADQQAWYQRKADWNRSRARLWGSLMLALQIAAAVGAFLKGFGLIEVDLFGLAGAAAASAAAWLETKQHHTISRAYKVAAEELADIQALIPGQQSEDAWARFVAEAEEAISREHTMWKASSRSREPVTLA